MRAGRQTSLCYLTRANDLERNARDVLVLFEGLCEGCVQLILEQGELDRLLVFCQRLRHVWDKQTGWFEPYHCRHRGALTR